MEVPFKQATESEHYYLNKFQVSLDKGGKTLEEGQKYVVISPSEKKGERMTQSFDNPNQSIDYFKAQKGNSELAIIKGKDFEHKVACQSFGCP